ncbi:L-rhamnose mutarotase [Prosthecomicrobium sp. N25]|uniref:L-rhamnose mutarotase n=1 Tax=Prosthecomicrobium sp. N25 TaxID=3129254 RepID=UPI003077F0A0
MSDTETIAFALKLRPGMAAEYKARHDALWPEMKAMLLGSGILHYEIYLDEASHTLFAHILRRTDHTMPANRTNPVMLRWRAHMADVLEMDGDMAVSWPLEKMFELKA